MSAAAEPRDRATRRADALAMLASAEIDVWVATASPGGAPHLVPLSLAWVEGRAVIAVEERSITARNVADQRVARLAVGPTRDVVLLDVELERTVGVDADAELGAGYAAQADWDPRGLAGYVFLVLRPSRVQAWREANELRGRVLMREGEWLP
ncbi:pyridoxamine 5'-phosphate oxidase family protein [Microbacterium sp. SSM24]|uniref:pyridoxamine 5'-phosphate oxidase family protein n=1 Tax=Microbacterium sp. SSM24 TaxID=2991714 RepID=UPI00222672A9|nr:pyridoxamine 5'-phosphate oxidase family protein [Microbacterium sp. SSM24]MCW3494461.1 pyridoxamine 5'-phosphate oxidase family protein [Microbacterium sp. SSM24]